MNDSFHTSKFWFFSKKAPACHGAKLNSYIKLLGQDLGGNLPHELTDIYRDRSPTRKCPKMDYFKTGYKVNDR